MQENTKKILKSLYWFVHSSSNNATIENKKSGMLCVYGEDVWNIIIEENHNNRTTTIGQYTIGTDARLEILKMIQYVPPKSKKNLIYLMIFMGILLFGSYFILPIKGFIALAGIVCLLIISKYFSYLDILTKTNRVIDVLS